MEDTGTTAGMGLMADTMEDMDHLAVTTGMGITEDTMGDMGTMVGTTDIMGYITDITEDTMVENSVSLIFQSNISVTPGPVPYETCICFNIDTIFSWSCHVSGL